MCFGRVLDARRGNLARWYVPRYDISRTSIYDIIPISFNKVLNLSLLSRIFSEVLLYSY